MTFEINIKHALKHKFCATQNEEFQSYAAQYRAIHLTLEKAMSISTISLRMYEILHF
jgi:hypothetical protein